MLPSYVPAAILIDMADGAPTSPTPPLPTPLRAPRGRRIELPSNDTPTVFFLARQTEHPTHKRHILH